MNYFVEKLKKPSAAIQAMIDGLIAHTSWNGFRLDTGTFGKVRGGVCYGCVATCATQHIQGLNFTSHEAIVDVEDRSYFLEVPLKDLQDFESAVDEFRTGEPTELLELFDIPGPYPDDLWLEQDWYLETDTWKQELSKIEAYRDKLIAEGY